MADADDTLFNSSDLASLYEDTCAKAPKGFRVIVQAAQRIEACSELFYTSVLVNNCVLLRGMLDSGN